VVLGVIFCAGLFIVAEMLVPIFMVKANQIWLQEVRKKNIYASRTNDIWMRAARQIIHIKQYVPEEKRATGITIHIFNDAFRLIKRIDAESGYFENDRWRLDDAIQQVFETASGDHRIKLHHTIMADMDLNPDDLARAAKQSDEMGLAELGRYIQKVEREGYGAARYRVDFHSKIAAPFVCIFLSLLGTGIALRGKMHEGIPLSITYGLGIAFLYWIFNSFCLSLGYAERMPPVVAAWVANFVFLGVAGSLLLNAD
jgi:lipopolysaccharide export system permease protein